MTWPPPFRIRPVTIPVLTNDFDTESNQLAILQVSAPAHGTVVINSNAPVTTPELSSLFQFAAVQLSNTVVQMGNTNTYPRSTLSNGTWSTVNNSDWTCGFFPGCLWYLYEQTGDPHFETWAQEWTAGIAAQQFNTNTDDVGFMFNTSFGNGYRMTGSSTYKSVLLQAAHSLTNRFNAIVGCLADDLLLTPPEFQVIMDTTMNTELLYHAADINGDTTLSAKAMSHAERAMTNQIRPDTSTFHLVLYSTVNGALLYQGTRAGYSATSTWARAHAWSIYGFTMAYRETGYAAVPQRRRRKWPISISPMFRRITCRIGILMPPTFPTRPGIPPRRPSRCPPWCNSANWPRTCRTAPRSGLGRTTSLNRWVPPTISPREPPAAAFFCTAPAIHRR